MSEATEDYKLHESEVKLVSLNIQKLISAQVRSARAYFFRVLDNSVDPHIGQGAR